MATLIYRTQLFEKLGGAIGELDSPREQFACSWRAERLQEQLHDTLTYPSTNLAAYVLHADDFSAGLGKTNELQIQGDDAIHDLTRLIDAISAEVTIAAEDASEPVFTTDQLVQRWNVSAKTIGRWRSRGLIARGYLFDGKHRVGYLQSTVARFEQTHPQRLRRASRSSSPERRGAATHPPPAQGNA